MSVEWSGAEWCGAECGVERSGAERSGEWRVESGEWGVGSGVEGGAAQWGVEWSGVRSEVKKKRRKNKMSGPGTVVALAVNKGLGAVKGWLFGIR